MKIPLILLLFVSLASFGQGGNSRMLNCTNDANLYEGENVNYKLLYSGECGWQYFLMSKNSFMTISGNIERVRVVYNDYKFDPLTDLKPKIIFKKCVQPEATFSNDITVEFPKRCNIQIIRTLNE